MRAVRETRVYAQSSVWMAYFAGAIAGCAPAWLHITGSTTPIQWVAWGAYLLLAAIALGFTLRTHIGTLTVRRMNGAEMMAMLLKVEEEHGTERR